MRLHCGTMMAELSNTLFIGLGTSAPSWYRCGLPANELGADWLALWTAPKGHDIFKVPWAGTVSKFPDFNDYDTIIVQQPRGDQWLAQIKEWQKQGKTVFFEVDDFLHGVHKIKEHSNRHMFAKPEIKKLVACMKQCDAMICSTEFLSEQYKKYNPNQYVCKIGIDTHRYKSVRLPERKHLVIGWAGGTGHHHAVGSWLEEVIKLVNLYDDVGFASTGTNYAQVVAHHCGNDKALSIPWVSIENYPFSLTNFDIVIAPAHESKYFLSKSDLRWLEASALGIPVVADPRVYSEVVDGSTGLLASTPEEVGDQLMELIEDSNLRHDIGTRAQCHVVEKRDIAIMAKQWIKAIEGG